MKWRIEKCWIPGGHLGVISTLNRMVKLVNDSIHHPIIRKYAIEITSQNGKDRIYQAHAIRNWVLDNMPFIRDPYGVEMVRSPENLLHDFKENHIIFGDCDDMAVLSAALGKSIGMEVGFMILGFIDKSNPYTHVYTVLNTGKGWLPVDLSDQYPEAKNLIVKKSFQRI